jgi:hypothetical protein
LAKTTGHKVKGVESKRPNGPHNHVQNDAATTTATGERPALRPQTSGSITCPVSGSTTAKSAMVQSAMLQSLPTAAAKAIGKTAANIAPI